MPSVVIVSAARCWRLIGDGCLRQRMPGLAAGVPLVAAAGVARRWVLQVLAAGVAAGGAAGDVSGGGGRRWWLTGDR